MLASLLPIGTFLHFGLLQGVFGVKTDDYLTSNKTVPSGPTPAFPTTGCNEYDIALDTYPEGRAFVFKSGTWMPVCYDYFGNTENGVISACQSMGYSSGGVLKRILDDSSHPAYRGHRRRSTCSIATGGSSYTGSCDGTTIDVYTWSITGDGLMQSACNTGQSIGSCTGQTNPNNNRVGAARCNAEGSNGGQTAGWGTIFVCSGTRSSGGTSGCFGATTATSTAAPSAVGDPHLTNLRGEKFDIHDGKHRLVHYPRGVPENDALLMVDVEAVDMGHESDCYSVYLRSVKLSGKWLGEAINIHADTNNSVASSSASAFSMFFASEQMDWTTLSKQNDFHPKLNGMMPVTVTTNMRKASGEDALGGEAIALKIGDEHPVLVQVWSSHGKNQLTHDREVRYLNVEVQNLPKNSGGIIGQDSYSRPSESRCDMIQEERDLLQYAEKDDAGLNLLRLSRPKWTASAIVQQ